MLILIVVICALAVLVCSLEVLFRLALVAWLFLRLLAQGAYTLGLMLSRGRPA